MGVVANVLKDGLDQQPQAEVYVLAAHGALIRREVNLVLRTAGAPAAYAAAVRHIVAELCPDAAVDAVEPLAAQVADSMAGPRFAAAVLLSLSGLALLLAAVGLYGVLSYAVARRHREIGVRCALGATHGDIVAMVVREGMSLVILGETQLMQALLVGIAPFDPASFALASAALLLVALFACLIPARRAAGVDPLVALRCD